MLGFLALDASRSMRSPAAMRQFLYDQAGSFLGGTAFALLAFGYPLLFLKLSRNWNPAISTEMFREAVRLLVLAPGPILGSFAWAAIHRYFSRRADQLKTNGPFKKCSGCGTVRNISYFSLDNSSPDGHGHLCVACTSPETWAFTQNLKSAFANQQQGPSTTAQITHLAAIQQAGKELCALPPGKDKMDKVMQRADEIMRSWGWTPNQ
jgi:hypothetical protein